MASNGDESRSIVYCSNILRFRENKHGNSLNWMAIMRKYAFEFTFQLERRVSELVFHFPNYHCKLVCRKYLETSFWFQERYRMKDAN